ncbi:hypothetical protein I6G56_00955 (plasmid) [Burkholderia humptydooensis]|uniref:Uncharacterized protein n=2 Tax=Burkholderia humptydooensis TaxID=430531 RepID=A0A7U4P7N4_9BURK|nr:MULTISPECIES: hypothetical protein [Burkholderia]AJY38298.1 hypothetical protein BW21_6239 [Burkholderia sp. 2002721687]ALX44510.1 hypothetical protein AQ610_18310 [Burkholderia humptydooensis]KWZ47021.1 hypothetical protein WS92_30270 [Burkholderia sp. MSMB1588]QPS41888.1 hypothetical protein I6G56_00955 [Burkholderia humptydooensis]
MTIPYFLETRGIAMADGQLFAEGRELDVFGDSLDTQDIFSLAMTASLELRGQPVVCQDLLPELSMRIEAHPLPAGGNPGGLMQYIDHAWRSVAEVLIQRHGRLERDECVTLTAPAGVHMTLARTSGLAALPPHAMRLRVDYSPVILARFLVARHELPLIQQSHRTTAPFASVKQPHPPRLAPDTPSIAELIREALIKTEQAADDRFARLPMPVRYRASGALGAWSRVRAAAGPSGTELTKRLRDDPISLMRSDFGTYLEWWSNGSPTLFRSTDDRARGHGTLCWQMFDACEGVLFEPTPPLHHLLDDAFIADDVPVGTIELPAETMCIIPDPSWWGHRGGLDAIMLFRRGPGSHSGYATSDVINVLFWTDVRAESWLETGNIAIPLDDPQRTIRQFLDGIGADLTQKQEVDADTIAATVQHWRRVLDYAIKMLLYLATGEAQVVQDRAYTNAPRDFGGLGKRKRTERLAQIEMLYDRHVIGPAVLDAAPAASSPSDGTHREVRGHWRRPHFKMQPHGPQRSLRKLVFIGPTLVRADRLGLA